MKKSENIKCNCYLGFGILAGLIAFIFSVIELINPAEDWIKLI